MIVFPDQPVEGLLEARQVHEALRWQGVLCDVLNGDVVDAAALRRYQRAVLPGQPTLAEWMQPLDFIRRPKPLTRDDWRPISEAYQRKKPITPPRDTGLAARVLEATQPDRLFEPPPGSRIAAAAWSKPGRLVLHLLNYRVPVGRDNADHAETVGPLQITLPLTPGCTATGIRAWSPERAGALPLTFKQQGSKATFTLPKLRIYEGCEATVRGVTE